MQSWKLPRPPVIAFRINNNMKKGFTLIEILVVTTIIAVFAASGVFSYGQFVRSSQDARRKADMELIRAAIEQFRSTNNRYPTNAELNITGGGNLCDPVAMGGCANGTYIQGIPRDPRSPTNSYWYNQISASDYTIGSCIQGGGTSSCGACGTCPVTGAACNYCLGPYGLR